jgi:hypothetical protein
MVMQGIEQPPLIGTVSSPATIRGDGVNNESRGGNTEETSAGRFSTVEATATNPIAPADTISDVPNGESAQTPNDVENDESEDASTVVDTEDGTEKEMNRRLKGNKEVESGDVPNGESAPASNDGPETAPTLADTGDCARNECTKEPESSTPENSESLD